MTDGEVSDSFFLSCIENPAALSVMLARASLRLRIDWRFDDIERADSCKLLFKAQELFLSDYSELDMLDSMELTGKGCGK